MPTLELQTAGRQFRRQFGTSIRQSLIRALAELITNSDDSYRRLGDRYWLDFGQIDIHYDRRKRRLAVVDRAEGLDTADMARMYPQYGAATSGLYEDYNVRGYFGKGIKDVLFSMEQGRVQSIKDERVYSARFYWEGDRPLIEIDDNSQVADESARDKLGIPTGNGTAVSFTIPETMSLPRHDSLLRNLANFYMLRLIHANQKRRVYLHTISAGGREVSSRVEYHFPTGDLLLENHFEVAYDAGFPVGLTLYRAESPLSQTGEDREGGILIYDQEKAVLDLTLFEYDHEEYAARLFGMMKIGRFRELLKADEEVLTDTRDGLERRHPFTQALAEIVQARLRPIVEQELHTHLQNVPRSLTGKQRKRLWNSIDQINVLLSNLSGIDLDLEDEDMNGPELPPQGGMAFRPQTVQILKQRSTVVPLRIDTSIIPSGTEVELFSTDEAVGVEPRRFIVPEKAGTMIVAQNITLWGNQPGSQTEIQALSGIVRTSLQVRVIEDAYPIPEGGLAFMPDRLSLANNSRRRAYLYISEETAKPGDSIHFSVDRYPIEIGLDEVKLDRADYKRGVARVVVPLKGTGIGRKAVLTAKVNDRIAELQVEVVSKTERRRRGPYLLTGYRFDPTTPSRARASYDEESGLIWIYLRNPIVERYFGSLPLQVALNTPHCQILLAEIIMEQVAWLSRRKMIEAGAAMYLGSNHTEEDLAAVRRFMHDYGDKIHSWIADDQTIERAIQNLFPELKADK